jgi:hypothetical protein
VHLLNQPSQLRLIEYVCARVPLPRGGKLPISDAGGNCLLILTTMDLYLVGTDQFRSSNR